MSQYDPKFDLKINIGHYDFLPDYEDYLMEKRLLGIMDHYDLYFNEFALYLEDYLMYVHHTLGVQYESVRPDVRPKN